MRTHVVMEAALLIWACESGKSERDGGVDTAGGQAIDGASVRGGAGADAGAAGASAGGGAGASGRGGTGAGGRGITSGSGGMAAPDGGAAGDDSDHDSGAAGMDAPTSACLDDITSYTEMGPFAFSTARSGQVHLWIPDVPEGCKVPVVHFSNATGATCSAFAAVLERFASHGFLATCYENASNFDGTHCLTALMTALSEYADVAAMKIGSTGQETGGDAALACIYRAEETWGDAATYAGHAVAPFVGTGAGAEDWQTEYAQIESPVFMFNGSEDSLVSAGAVRTAYDALDTEKYWYEATGAPHIPVPASWATESAIVFFRWKLLGDEAAGAYFAAMPDGNRWDLQEQDP